MEFIVLSDNHGKTNELDLIRAKFPHARAFIHCGDSELTKDLMKPFYTVTGNNDYYERYPDDMVIDLDGVRIYVTHGHLLPYGNRVKSLMKKAKEHRCIIACTGHTHIFMDKVVDGIQVINPGSLFYNRDGSKPCYAHVSIVNGIITVTRLLAEDL